MASEPSGILVPAYDRPNPLSDWRPLFSVAPYLSPGRLVVVANDNNGPGYTFRFDAQGKPVEILGYAPPQGIYVNAIQAVVRRCGMVVGYVHDCYGGHFDAADPPSNCPRTTEDGSAPALPGKPTIEADIVRWFDAYPAVRGIFIDQVSRDDIARAGRLKTVVEDAYRERWSHFPDRRPVVVLNPGSIPSTDFMEETDPAIVVIQEQSFAEFQAGWPPVGWVRDRDGGGLSIPARRLAIIAHSMLNDPQDIASLVGIARRYGIGSVYANDADGSDYNELSGLLVPLGQQICRLHTKFGLPCWIVTAPACWGSQAVAQVRAGATRVLRR